MKVNLKYANKIKTTSHIKVKDQLILKCNTNLYYTKHPRAKFHKRIVTVLKLIEYGVLQI